MKVALVSTYMPPHPGGIEHVAANTFEAYRRVGVEVRWVTSRVPPTLSAADGPITRVPCANQLEDRLGVPVPVWGGAAWRALREACAWADVVHVVEALYLPSAMAVLAAGRAGKPVLVCQNLGEVPYESRILRAVQRVAWSTLGRGVLRRATVVVVATPAAETFVRRLLGPRLPPSATVPVGIDTARFRPATREERAAARIDAAVGGGRPVVLFAGRLVEKKGVRLVLEAARQLPEADILIAGDGPLRSLLEGAPVNVRWLRQVDHGRMLALYWAVEAALLPSRGEGLPLFVQEAMACGLPVVVSEDEEYATPLIGAGLCFGARRSPDSIATAIRRALGAAPPLAVRVRAWAESQWDLDRMAARYLELVRSVGA